ncbi:hypothetical protein L208DRAFT_1393387 [Tricholoma matsutake]|nr:hypothetical protein L208DRAFT_1393387 [Tricholoma matsutake 945]
MANTHFAETIPTTPPSMPRNVKPLFTPHTRNRGVARPTTPDSDHSSEDDDSSFSLAMLPKGHQLVMRGVVPTSNETPTTALKDLLVNLGADPRYKDFSQYGLEVQPFSDRASNISSACYVEISPCGEAEPRVDLLEIVMDAIVESKPDLEVRWSASKKGKSDKRLSCRLLDLYPGITDRSAFPPEHLPLIKAHIEKKGYKITSIFASFGGPQIMFLLLSDADRFMALQFIDVPAKVSKERTQIEPLKEIPILCPFELVVKGARDYDLLEGVLERWIRKTVPHSLIETRSTPLNSDLIIFSMATWADTAKILRSGESFWKCFCDHLSAPRLLWDYNDDLLNKKSLGDEGRFPDQWDCRITFSTNSGATWRSHDCQAPAG